MPVIDLTLSIPIREKGRETVQLEELALCSAGTAYTGMVYDFHFGSMAGTYIDFPGHIKETDDGLDSANYPIEKLFRLDADVIRMDRTSGSGGISADELRGACGREPAGGALVINALGSRRFDEVEERSVYLSKDAVGWIVATGSHLLISDVYESKELHGVFYDLFDHGISTVCCAVNLDKLIDPKAKISVFPLRLEGVTQIPCRIVAEVEG